MLWPLVSLLGRDCSPHVDFCCGFGLLVEADFYHSRSCKFIAALDSHCGCASMAVGPRCLRCDVSLPQGLGVEAPIPGCDGCGTQQTEAE